MREQSHSGGRLPSAYQEVEYIGKDSNNGSYINTGISAVANTIDVQSKYSIDASADCYLMAVRVSGGSKQFCFCGYYSWKHQFAYSNYFYAGSYSPGTTVTADVHFEQNNQKIYIDETLIDDRSTNALMDIDLPYYLFGRNYGGSLDKQIKAGKIYYWKIKKNGTLVRDYVPCYRKSDDEIGLFDLVSNGFFPNDGAGLFIKGADVT